MTGFRRRRPAPTPSDRRRGDRAAVRGALDGVGAIVGATAAYTVVAGVLAIVVAWLT